MTLFLRIKGLTRLLKLKSLNRIAVLQENAQRSKSYLTMAINMKRMVYYMDDGIQID